MRVTKFPQSCLLLEKGGESIVIDPGSITMARHSADEFGDVAAVLYTHSHHDHFDAATAETFLERGIPLYGNSDVCTQHDSINEIGDARSFAVGSFEIEPHDLPHVPMVDGSPGPPNTGFMIDDLLFHPGDGITIGSVHVPVLALPIAGPSISFRDAYAFAVEVSASKVIPMHFDHFIADPEMFAKYCDVAEVIVLAPSESQEIE